jgi:hypothetical protein
VYKIVIKTRRNALYNANQNTNMLYVKLPFFY